MIFTYKGKKYPEYLKTGNAAQHVMATARLICTGNGLDIGGNKWGFPGAVVVDLINGGDAMDLPIGHFDFIFSSHCLEHVPDAIGALRHWQSRLKKGAPLFLYLPHPSMEYWLPQNCTKHLHSWQPSQMAKILMDLGFKDVIHSDRDLAWSFSVVGWR